jgi:hypothetical protein
MSYSRHPKLQPSPKATAVTQSYSHHPKEKKKMTLKVCSMEKIAVAE